MLKLVILSFLVTLQNAESVTYNFGGCPKIKSFENFNITKFLGLWYIVEANDLSITCATMNFKATNSSSKFDVEQSTNFRTLPFVQHIVIRTGRMKVVDEDNPAGMKIRWHWSYAPEYMVVFDTDYYNYAGVFFCSIMGITSETKIYILSRTSTLHAQFKDKVKESLKLNDFSTSGMTKVEHKDCPTEKSEDTFKFKVKLDTLSPKSVGEQIDKKIKENFEKEDCSHESNHEQTTLKP